MKLGGTEYTIAYSDTLEYQKDEFQATEYLDSYLPVDLVTALSSVTYWNPGDTTTYHVLDALSPFQVMSKLWACSVLSKIIGEDYGRSPFVYPGAWYGQLNSMMARKMPDYITRQSVLIDLDHTACEIAKYVLEHDQWQDQKSQVKVICGDALTFDLSAFADECAASPIVVWTGIEHFDPVQVKNYIRDHSHAKAVYLLQATNMSAPDHVGLIHSCEELEQYFDGVPIYSAELKTTIGSRFQLVFAT